MIQYDFKDYKIISGGQTGVDIAGLHAARDLQFKTGGWAPHGWITTDGRNEEELRSLGLQEHDGNYRERTVQNVKDSSITLIISRYWASAGTKLTISSCKKYDKPFITFDETGFVREMHNIPAYLLDKINNSFENKLSQEMNDNESVTNHVAQILVNYPIINVAGNAEKNARGIETTAYNLLYVIFFKLKNFTSK